MTEIPVINRLIEKDGVYYAFDKNDDLLFATKHKYIADIYYAIPKVLQEQASIINKLSQELEDAKEAHASLLMGILADGSNLIH